MLKDSLLSLFERDLNRLKQEINLFVENEDIWITPGSIKNSPGNLCLHICGNIKHFIGATLGNTGYVREREKEFSLKNVPKEELLKNVDETLDIVKITISNLNDEIFNSRFPIDVFEKEMTTEYFLIHLTTHLNYHFGQINYLRRLLIE
jgi:uncharacterized damage-inducible protein DinB